jgi:hypothetical protein
MSAVRTFRSDPSVRVALLSITAAGGGRCWGRCCWACATLLYVCEWCFVADAMAAMTCRAGLLLLLPHVRQPAAATCAPACCCHMCASLLLPHVRQPAAATCAPACSSC